MGKETIKRRKSVPAITPEARENQLISLAINLAEEKLRDGTASNQLICHYLKLGTTEHMLEKIKLEEEVKNLKAKTEALESTKRIEELYSQAISAMQSYSGRGNDD